MKRLVWVLVAAALSAQITYPLVSGTARDVVTVAVVGFLAAAVLTHAAVTRGVAWASVLFVTTAGIGILAEIVGTATGFPFGSYFYATDRLGPDILGVPAVVPLAWTAGFYPIRCAVTYVLERSSLSPGRQRRHRIVATALGMVGWDLYLDTQMVTDGQWTWTSDIAGLPGIPSIPVSNYLGWFVTALVMAVVVDLVGDRVAGRRPVTSPMSDAAPLVLFLWTWLGSALAHSVFLDGDELRFSAVYGFCAMSIVGVPFVVTWLRETRRATVVAP
ncbi:carotenoid biosynthesis protein [Rhodococcoides kyotonense]|uniref:Putative membrane protein n=1 Tax=Rhodococcoides kyotonense TaxID=398843 RepID=A0A239KY74_9NOCA|nr:carotenoid biosynthesis protein [Rhodococcus kyotonensis]SNT22449.1 putative membrane protein [Rhodococcus kyotonensis]